jgi:hypothetical protein
VKNLEIGFLVKNLDELLDSSLPASSLWPVKKCSVIGFNNIFIVDSFILQGEGDIFFPEKIGFLVA